MRRFIPFFVFMMMTLPVQAKNLHESALPDVMQDALLDAAATGNPLVIEAVADRLGRLFPASKSEIALYMSDIAKPASQVVIVVNDMIRNTPSSFAFYNPDAVFYPEQEAEDPAMAMAAELNDLDVGAGMSDL